MWANAPVAGIPCEPTEGPSSCGTLRGSTWSPRARRAFVCALVSVIAVALVVVVRERNSWRGRWHPFGWAPHGFAGIEPWYGGATAAYSLTFDDCNEALCLGTVTRVFKKRPGIRASIYPVISSHFPFHCLPHSFDKSEWRDVDQVALAHQLHSIAGTVDTWMSDNNITDIDWATDGVRLCRAIEQASPACPYDRPYLPTDCEGRARLVGELVTWLRDAIADGHEVGSHGVVHVRMDEATKELVDAEISVSAWWLRAIVGVEGPMTIAYPYTHVSKDVIAASAPYFEGARCGATTPDCSEPNDRPRALYGVRGRFVDIDAEGNNAFVRGAIENRAWRVTTLHGFTQHTFKSVAEDAFEEHLDYVQQQASSGEVWVDSFVRVLRYARLRDTLTAEVLQLGRDDGWDAGPTRDRRHPWGDQPHAPLSLLSVAVSRENVAEAPLTPSTDDWPHMSIYVVAEGPTCIMPLRRATATVSYGAAEYDDITEKAFTVDAMRTPLPNRPLWGFPGLASPHARCKLVVSAPPPKAGDTATVRISLEWAATAQGAVQNEPPAPRAP
eukprot:Opistho-1_new@75017